MVIQLLFEGTVDLRLMYTLHTHNHLFQPPLEIVKVNRKH